MGREKFDFGIDLGTTNSAIACMDNGKIKIIKSDGYQKDTTPSRVQITKKGLRVGDSADESSKNIFIEFKRTMGANKTYSCEASEHEYNSEELSAEVLKQLKSYVVEEDIQAAVITVPNQFHQSQIDATQRAAELAGFDSCELLQEPIAASMAFGIEADSMSGHWLVFDFGGGTFDAALMKVDEGIMKVIDTDGNNHLGGKDIDSAIINKILIPSLQKEFVLDEPLADNVRGRKLQATLKTLAERVKISLSSKTEEFVDSESICEDDEGEELIFEFTVSLKEYENVVTPIFQSAIDIAKGLIERKIKSKDLGAILLVGGPTFSQTLRRMMSEQFDCKIDTSIDPMTSVAMGAALFASTKTIPLNLQKRDFAKIQLTLKYPETTVETEENLGVMINRATSEGEIPDILSLEVSRTDGGWTSGKVKIDDAEIIEIKLDAGKPNVFDITLSDNQGSQLACEPARITIIQGLKAAKSTLPHSICIDSVLTGSGKQRLVVLEGLEKNNTLPAKGKGVFKTQKAIRPGNKADVLTIPIIEGEPGEQSVLNQGAAEIKCTGEDLSALLPEGSEVELTVSIDSSRRITLSAYFPYIDENFDVEVAKTRDTQLKEVDADVISAEIKKAQHTLTLIEGQNADRLYDKLTDLQQELQNASNDYDTKQKISENLKSILKELDRVDAAAEWPKIEQDIRDALEDVRLSNEQYGDNETTKLLVLVESKAREVIEQQNIKLGLDLIEQIHAMGFALIRQETGLWISYIKGFDDDFDTQQWSDPNAARQLINQAKQIIATQPSREKIEQIVFALFNLLPEKDIPVSGQTNSELLLK